MGRKHSISTQAMAIDCLVSHHAERFDPNDCSAATYSWLDFQYPRDRRVDCGAVDDPRGFIFGWDRLVRGDNFVWISALGMIDRY